MVNLRVEWEDGRLQKNIAELDEKTKLAISAAFAYQEGRSTAYLKTEAPWTDRTGAARSGIHAEYHRSRSRYELILLHAVSYGIWLEVCNSGRYAIILPALRAATRELTGVLDNLWRKM